MHLSPAHVRKNNASVMLTGILCCGMASTFIVGNSQTHLVTKPQPYSPILNHTHINFLYHFNNYMQ